MIMLLQILTRPERNHHGSEGIVREKVVSAAEMQHLALSAIGLLRLSAGRGPLSAQP